MQIRLGMAARTGSGGEEDGQSETKDVLPGDFPKRTSFSAPETQPFTLLPSRATGSPSSSFCRL